MMRSCGLWDVACGLPGNLNVSPTVSVPFCTPEMQTSSPELMPTNMMRDWMLHRGKRAETHVMGVAGVAGHIGTRR